MEFSEKNCKTLLVSSSPKMNSALLSLLSEYRCFPVTVSENASGARRLMTEDFYDTVIINSPLPDETGTELAIDICESGSSGVLLIVKAENYADITAKVAFYGVLTLQKPVPYQVMSQSLLVLAGMRERLRRAEKKPMSLDEKMEEIRIINRAKLLLIEKKKMTEKEAHRYIEKSAMDRCVSRRKIAEKILSGGYKE